MNIKSSGFTRSGHSAFTCGQIHTVILAINDLSIYLPFCAKATVTTPQLELKIFTCKKVSHPPRSKKKNKKRKTDATIYRLQTVCSKKLSARTISKQCGFGECARCQGEEKSTACEQQRLC